MLLRPDLAVLLSLGVGGCINPCNRMKHVTMPNSCMSKDFSKLFRRVDSVKIMIAVILIDTGAALLNVKLFGRLCPSVNTKNFLLWKGTANFIGYT